MTNYIVRRNNWGKPSCDYITDTYPELVVINKDKQEMPNDAEWVVRWATTNTLGPQETPPKVINSAQAIHKVFNKGQFRHLLSKKGLAPETWLSSYAWDMSGGRLPVIIRPLKHSASEDLHFCQNYYEVMETCQKFIDEDKDFYISEFIPKDHEYRVFIGSGRVLAVMEKIPNDPDAVSWGIDETWRYIDWSDWPQNVVSTACAAFSYSNLHIGAVDIMTFADRAYCLEVNSGPLMSPYYGAQIAKAIKWIIDNDHRTILPVGTKQDGFMWKNYVHPALSKGAVL